MNSYRLQEIRAIVARRNAYALPLVDAIRAEADRDASYRATLAEWLVNGKDRDAPGHAGSALQRRPVRAGIGGPVPLPFRGVLDLDRHRDGEAPAALSARLDREGGVD